MALESLHTVAINLPIYTRFVFEAVNTHIVLNSRKENFTLLLPSPNCKNTSFIMEHNFHFQPSLCIQDTLFRAIFTIHVTKQKDFAAGVEGLKDFGFVGSVSDEEAEPKLRDSLWVTMEKEHRHIDTRASCRTCDAIVIVVMCGFPCGLSD